ARSAEAAAARPDAPTISIGDDIRASIDQFLHDRLAKEAADLLDFLDHHDAEYVRVIIRPGDHGRVRFQRHPGRFFAILEPAIKQGLYVFGLPGQHYPTRDGFALWSFIEIAEDSGFQPKVSRDGRHHWFE